MHRVKVLIRYEGSKAGEFEVESVWAIPSHNGYELDNIPFFAREIALGDVVSAKEDSDGALVFEQVMIPRGHSTIRLWFASPGDVQKARDELRNLGCASELNLTRLVSVDIPPNVPYAEIKRWLKQGEGAQTFEYEEGCLGQGSEQSLEAEEAPSTLN